MLAVNSNNKKTDISILIINYNLAKEIENCLNSLLNVLDFQNKVNYEVIIVDNNSPDKNLPEVEKKFKQNNFHFYYLEKNLGFGQGNNYGFSKASGQYICFLNPDTIIIEDFFPHIISLFEKDETIGIIGPKQQIRAPFFDFSAGFSPNILFELFNLIGVGVFLEGFLMHYYAKFIKNKYLKVNWILGAAVFIKANLFRKINGFDRDYFMFFEEVDLCKRVINEGFKVIYEPKLKIHHIGSVSGKKDYRLYTIRTYSSKYIFISKHYKSSHKILMSFLLFTQVFSQIIIWTFLLPLKKQKSKQKLDAFFYLLKNNMKYEHRD
jgi:GT2 family glycosyltransferase